MLAIVVENEFPFARSYRHSIADHDEIDTSSLERWGSCSSTTHRLLLQAGTRTGTGTWIRKVHPLPGTETSSTDRPIPLTKERVVAIQVNPFGNNRFVAEECCLTTGNDLTFEMIAHFAVETQ